MLGFSFKEHPFSKYLQYMKLFLRLVYLGNEVFPLFFAKIEDNSAPRGWAGKDDDGGIEEDFGGRRTLDWPDHENGVDFGDEEWDSDGESVGEVDEEMAAAVERELFS